MKNQLQKLKKIIPIALSDGIKRTNEANGEIMKGGLF